MKPTKTADSFFPAFFDDFFGRDWMNSMNWGPNSNRVPAVNIKETENDFHIEVMAPGRNKEEFKLELNRDTLTISYDHKDENEDKKEGYVSREFRHVSFKRSFTLPLDKVDVEKIGAKYDSGILNISVPKKEQVKKDEAKTIAIG